MARGILSGVVTGTLVSALGLGTASVLTGDRLGSQPEAGGVEVPAGSGFGQPKDDTAAMIPGLGAAPEAGQAPQVNAPTPDDVAALSGEATAAPEQPETGAVQDGLSEPQSAADTGGVDVQTEEPVLPSPQTVAPEAPQSEESLSISTEPAQPAAPLVDEGGAFDQGGAFPTEDLAMIADGAGSPEDTPASVPEPASDPKAATLPAADEEMSGTIGNLAPEIESGRLPEVGDEPEPTEEVPAASEEEAAPAEDTRPPLQRYAAEFETEAGKPLLSVVLIDDGSGLAGIEALADFPYPLSFAVDASWEGAAEAMARYRAAGFEVLAMIDLPTGAGAQDVEVALQSTFDRMPEVVAVMDGTGSGLQVSRTATDQLAPALLDSGHGAVMFSNGLNTAQKLLARSGVPSATVFRDFDGKGQNAGAVRRFLDQGAMKAGSQENGVIMVGRLRPETISALLLWGLQDRASSVSIAPVSALLRGDG